MKGSIFIIVAAACASSCSSVPRLEVEPSSVCEGAQSELEAARQAFFFAFPLYEMSRMRQRMLAAPGAEINSLRHRSTLSTPTDRYITTPNNDTLYSAAWLDLSAGPVRFSIPAMGRRYHSVELMDMFSDAFEILRNEGTETRYFLLVGPDWKGHAGQGETIVRSPTRDAWLVVRTYVDGEPDLIEAQKLQMAYTFEATQPLPADHDFAAKIPDKPDSTQFLNVVNTALARGQAPRIHGERLACFSAAGIVQGKSGSTAVLEPAMQQAWADNIDAFYAEARLAFETWGITRNGWQYPKANIAVFGTDDIYRSAMALGGLAALPVEEAINPMTSRDAEGRALSGASRYTLRIPGNIPVDGFWSLTLYESDGAGRWFLYDNVLDRYAVNSTTPGLVKEQDGAIVLEISHLEPPDLTNWLPAPKGDYRLVFRAYRPQREFLDGTFLLPPVHKVTG